MDIDKLMLQAGADIYYSKGLMDEYESHLNFFRNSVNSNVAQIDAKKAVIYDGDFFGYLNEINIEQKYHWLIMRINNMYSSSEFNKDKLVIIVPSNNEVENVRIAYMATGVVIQ